MPSEIKVAVIDVLAGMVHAIWSHWMKYMFSVIDNDVTIEGDGWGDGYALIHNDVVKKWKRQMNTDYKDLSESEKESGREIVREFLLK